MAKLGLPYLHIRFKQQGIASIRRNKRSVVALLLQDTIANGHYTVYTSNDIPGELSEDNVKQIELALKGYTMTPRKIEVVVEQIKSDGAKKFDVKSDGFKALETIKFNYLAVPFATEDEQESIATWVKTLNDNREKRCQFVGANTPADHPKIINYTMPLVSADKKNYRTEEYTARLAGMFAGTPAQIASTYAPLPELTSCTFFSRDEIDEKIGKGELVLIDDGEKIKIARGVNSLTTTSQIQGSKFRKIKIVEIMDTMADDIQMAAEDAYIGKYANSYDNKCLLMSAIKGYMEVLENESLLAKGESDVQIDMEAQTAYLKSIGYTTPDGRTPDEMEPFEIREADTEDKVFLVGRCKILDAIEEIELPIII